MKAFVFDLDNTLFDRYATILTKIENEWENVKKYVNPFYDTEQAYKHFCHTEKVYVYLGWHKIYEALKSEAFFNADNTPTYEQLSYWWEETNLKYAVPFDFTLPLLQKIKAHGYKLGLITNGWVNQQHTKLKLLGLDGIFDEVIVSGDFARENGKDENDREYWKPNKPIFELMAQRLGIKTSEMYYVGDNPLNDVRGAVNAGCVPVWIRSESPWPYQNSEVPKLNYKSVEGIEELI